MLLLFLNAIVPLGIFVDQGLSLEESVFEELHFYLRLWPGQIFFVVLFNVSEVVPGHFDLNSCYFTFLSFQRLNVLLNSLLKLMLLAQLLLAETCLLVRVLVLLMVDHVHLRIVLSIGHLGLGHHISTWILLAAMTCLEGRLLWHHLLATRLTLKWNSVLRHLNRWHTSSLRVVGVSLWRFLRVLLLHLLSFLLNHLLLKVALLRQLVVLVWNEHRIRNWNWLRNALRVDRLLTLRSFLGPSQCSNGLTRFLSSSAARLILRFRLWSWER